jgi:hypothetical protein
MFNDRWTLAAFINNLTNKHAQMDVAPWTSTQSESFYRLVSNQPLTAGVDVNVKF